MSTESHETCSRCDLGDVRIDIKAPLDRDGDACSCRVERVHLCERGKRPARLAYAAILLPSKVRDRHRVYAHSLIGESGMGWRRTDICKENPFFLVQLLETFAPARVRGEASVAVQEG